IDDPDHVYWAGRATLLRRPEDVPAYDDAFEAYWRGRDRGGVLGLPDVITLAIDDPDAPDGDGEGESEEAGDVLTVRYSPSEVLRERDFAEYTDAELEEAQRLMQQMRTTSARRRSRRRVPSSRHRGRPDLRRTVRRAMRTEGEPMRRVHT